MISILIPIHNGIEYIDDSVTSVINQTYEKWELIIGINGYQQNSIEYRIAKEYESLDNRIRVLDMYELKGKSNTLNAMLKHCTYDWVSILDVDDIWFLNKLECQVPFLDDYDVVGSQCVYLEKMEGINPKIPFGDISTFDFKSVNPIINSSVILRKKMANWNPDFDGVEDYDLWLRLRWQKMRFFNVEKVLVKHRIHPTSAFNSNNQQANLTKILYNYNTGYFKPLKN
jgi:glycosyltransferase involved in cell wall biosynthesis